MKADVNRLAELCREFRSGREQAFAEIYEAMYGGMHSFAVFRLAHDAHAAEDAVQEAFVETYRGIRTLKDPQAFYKWAYTILVRRCARRVGSREVTAGQEQEFLFENIPYEEGEFLPGALLEKQQTRSMVLEILDGLPDIHREVLTLRYLSETPVADMAEMLGVPEGTVKSRLSHAKRSMREKAERLLEKGVVFGVAPRFVLSEILQEAAAACANTGFTAVWAAVAAETGCTAALAGAGAASASGMSAANASAFGGTMAGGTGTAGAAAGISSAGAATGASGAGAAFSSKVMALILAGALAAGSGVGVGIGRGIRQAREEAKPTPAIVAPAEEAEQQEPAGEQDVPSSEQAEGFADSSDGSSEEAPMAAETTPAPTPEAAVVPAAALGEPGNTARNLSSHYTHLVKGDGVLYSWGYMLESFDDESLFKRGETYEGYDEITSTGHDYPERVGIYEIRPNRTKKLLYPISHADYLNYSEGTLYFVECSSYAVSHPAIYRLDTATGHTEKVYETNTHVTYFLTLGGYAYWIEEEAGLYKAPLSDFSSAELIANIDGDASYWNGKIYIRNTVIEGQYIGVGEDLSTVHSVDVLTGETVLLGNGLPAVMRAESGVDFNYITAGDDGILYLYPPESECDMALDMRTGEWVYEKTLPAGDDIMHSCVVDGVEYATGDPEGWYGYITWPDGTVERYNW